MINVSYFISYFQTYFLQQVLCRFIQSTDIDYIQLCLHGSCLVTIADQMCLIFGCKLWPKAPGKF